MHSRRRRKRSQPLWYVHNRVFRVVHGPLIYDRSVKHQGDVRGLKRSSELRSTVQCVSGTVISFNLTSAYLRDIPYTLSQNSSHWASVVFPREPPPPPKGFP